MLQNYKTRVLLHHWLTSRVYNIQVNGVPSYSTLLYHAPNLHLMNIHTNMITTTLYILEGKDWPWWEEKWEPLCGKATVYSKMKCGVRVDGRREWKEGGEREQREERRKERKTEGRGEWEEVMDVWKRRGEEGGEEKEVGAVSCGEWVKTEQADGEVDEGDIPILYRKNMKIINYTQTDNYA